MLELCQPLQVSNTLELAHPGTSVFQIQRHPPGNPGFPPACVSAAPAPPPSASPRWTFLSLQHGEHKPLFVLMHRNIETCDPNCAAGRAGFLGYVCPAGGGVTATHDVDLPKLALV